MFSSQANIYILDCDLNIAISKSKSQNINNMGRKTLLTEEEKGKFAALSIVGASSSAITEPPQKSHSVWDQEKSRKTAKIDSVYDYTCFKSRRRWQYHLKWSDKSSNLPFFSTVRWILIGSG